ncbi:MAG: thymidine phosphorylase [Clostridia bacterium]|nr:thymidine phosphorylase [Clostridia bacterium]
MNILDIIEKKKTNQILEKEEIEFFIKGYTNGEIADYQAAALIMAICINGMTEQEILNLTIAMTNSGDKIDFSDVANNIVDKHSTGGVGDKVTIILAPIIAALGVPVAKMSGRGLGITGGTADKLASIPGYDLEISIDEFKNNVRELGISLITQSLNLAPADKKIYALRDTISCTNSIPLIASSIMSKKIASGANSIVLDVTCGNGAFAKDINEARELARVMKKIGELASKPTICVLTSMEEPLGRFVGNNLEIKESVEFLQGKMEEDVKDVVFEIGSIMLKLAGFSDDLEYNKSKMQEVINNGKAFEKFKQLVAKQKGDVSYIENLEKFEKAKFVLPIYADRDGYISELDAQVIGKVSVEIGGGRMKKEDSIDYTVGLELCKKVSDKVFKGELIANIYAKNEEDAVKVSNPVFKAFKIEDSIIEYKSPIIEII